jgi:hypothetical protein
VFIDVLVDGLNIDKGILKDLLESIFTIDERNGFNGLNEFNKVFLKGV